MFARQHIFADVHDVCFSSTAATRREVSCGSLAARPLRVCCVWIRYGPFLFLNIYRRKWFKLVSDAGF